MADKNLNRQSIFLEVGKVGIGTLVGANAPTPPYGGGLAPPTPPLMVGASAPTPP